MSDILLIKLNIPLKKEKLKEFTDHMKEMKNQGCVVLPWYCTAELVPSDVEIKCEMKKPNCEDPTKCFECPDILFCDFYKEACG